MIENKAKYIIKLAKYIFKLFSIYNSFTNYNKRFITYH